MYSKYLFTAFTAFVIAGCGGGGGGDTTTTSTDSSSTTEEKSEKSIKVVDGYIKGSSVLVDINTKSVGVYDDGDIISTTDSSGLVTLYGDNTDIPKNTIIYATGGINISTNKPFRGTLSKVYSSEEQVIVTPLSTMVTTKFKNGTSLEDATAIVAKAFNIDEAAINADPTENLDTFKATEQIVAVSAILNDNIGEGLSSIANSLDEDANLTKALEEVDATQAETLKETLESVGEIVEKLEDVDSDAIEKYIDDAVIEALKDAIEEDENVTEVLDNAKNIDSSIVTARECLTFDVIKGENSDAFNITGPLDLDAKSVCEKDGVTISWINSDDTNAETYDDKNITLEANITKDGMFNIKGIELTIKAKAHKPTAVADSVSVNEDENITIDVLANDIDEDGFESSTIAIEEAPVNGSASVADNKIVYTPNADFNGADSLKYKVTDEFGAESIAEVTITVNPTNDAPTLSDFTIPTIDEDSSAITVELNATDIDGDNLTYSAVSSNDNIVTVTIDDSDNLVVTPKPNQNGEATITVTVSDGAASDSKQASVVINAINDAPVANDDSVSVNEDSNITIDVVANDTDIDSNITIKSIDSPANGVAEIQDGKVVYTPNANFNGTDSFSYTITDDEYDAQATVNITVNPVNDAPTASDDNATINEDNNVTIDVLANDTDIDSNLTIKSLNTPANGAAVIDNGKVIYTPNANFNGTDSFSYIVTDGEYDAEATVSITVNPVNDAPIINEINIAPINEDSAPVDITIDANDVDGDTLSYSASSSDTATATVSISDNILTITPQANKYGDVNITISVSDDELTTTKVATVTIEPVNDAPIAYDINATTTYDAPIDIELNATDIDSSDLTYSVTQEPANGEATVSGNTITYTPNNEYIGSDTIEYQVSDGELSATATITIDVQDAKILVSGEYSVIDLGSGDINKTVKIEDNETKSLYILFTNASEDNATVTVSDDAPEDEELNAETTTTSSEPVNSDFNQVPIEITEFNNKNIPPKDLNGSSTVAPLSEEEEEQEGDTKLLYAYNDEQNATLRKLVADIDTNNGTRTLKIWVADNTFGDDCNKSKCLTQDMVDEMADAFLKDGLNNDIYDWVSNIYGPEWGPHDSSYLIPESDEINIYLIDLGEDDSANGGTLGYFWAMENYTKDVYDKSNERVMFFIDSVMYANRGDDGESDYWKIRLHSTLAHELQHMINYYQRNVKRGLTSDTWVNEMLSGATQDAVADKIGDTAIRGFDPTIGDAGEPGIRDGRFPGFNDNNDKSLTNWVGGYSYSLVASFGTYIMRNYDGVKVLGDIQHYESNDSLETIVGAINDNGGDNLTFEDILKEWGIGVILSDKTDLPDSMPRYNFGDFIYSDLNDITYDLGSINFFNYEPLPKFHTEEEGKVEYHSNYYYKVGEDLSGEVKIDISIPDNVKATLIAK